MNRKTLFAGGDFSHWNKTPQIAECEFFATKLTEGASMVDATALPRVKQWANSKPCILYHVLTPKESVKKQFEHFKKKWQECNNISGALGVAIDIEAETGYFPKIAAGSKEMLMVQEFAEAVERELKRRPIIYCGDTYPRDFYKMIRANDWLLWIARYAPEKKLVNLPDIWQYTSNPYDKDYFYGTVEKLHSVLKKWG